MTTPATLATSGGILLLAWMTATPLAAAPAGLATEGRAQVIQRISDCRALADAGERLVCYDKAAAGLDAAEASGEVVVVDRAHMRSVRRQAFGFTLPSLAIFDRGGKDEEVDKLTLRIESARRDGSGKWVLQLEGGQVWRQIDTGELTRDPKPGAVATISHAALGSYKLTLGGASAIRVHRDN